jgi:hypothetical protein
MNCYFAAGVDIRGGILVFKTGVSGDPAQAGSIPVRLRESAKRTKRPGMADAPVRQRRHRAAAKPDPGVTRWREPSLDAVATMCYN